MNQIDIEVYEKNPAFGRCPNCATMRGELDRWLDQTDAEVEVNKAYIEDNPEIIEESGAQAAPIYKITDLETDEVIYVSGLQPDLLIDTLDGKLSLWD